jgi:hypothetical protein
LRNIVGSDARAHRDQAGDETSHRDGARLDERAPALADLAMKLGMKRGTWRERGECIQTGCRRKGQVRISERHADDRLYWCVEHAGILIGVVWRTWR